jgi:hypothetical protein
MVLRTLMSGGGSRPVVGCQAILPYLSSASVAPVSRLLGFVRVDDASHGKCGYHGYLGTLKGCGAY